MAREKKPPEPKDDIPAWFMTYSDVITLLMTFFILLLTFATTEPERFEKSISTVFSKGSATGSAGEKMTDIDKESFVNRLRVPASRIVLRGAEMPPITRDAAKETWGKGLRSLNEEEEKQNELTSHSFDIPHSTIFDSQDRLTDHGRKICQMVSGQLQDLPFRASVQFSDENSSARISNLLHYLFHTEMTRPGQVGMTLVRKEQLDPGSIRFVIERFTQSNQRSKAR